jgi:hypothetical protein
VREGRKQTLFPPSAPILDATAPLSIDNLNIHHFFVPVSRSPASLPRNPAEGWQIDPAVVPLVDTQTTSSSTTAPAHPAVDVVPTKNAATLSEGACTDYPPDEVIIMLQINHKFTTPDATERELRSLVTFLDCRRLHGLPPPSVVAVQEHALSGNGASPSARVYVAPGFPSQTITFSDTLCGLRFELSPTSFFQVCALGLFSPNGGTLCGATIGHSCHTGSICRGREHTTLCISTRTPPR